MLTQVTINEEKDKDREVPGDVFELKSISKENKFWWAATGKDDWEDGDDL